MFDLTLLLILIVSFFGIIIGYFLSLIAPEELIPGKDYLLFYRKLIISLLIGVFFTFFINDLLFKIITFFIAFVIKFIIFYKIKHFNNLSEKFYSIFYYLCPFFIIYVNNDLNYLIIISIIVFVLGTINSSIFSIKYVKDEKIFEKFVLFKKMLFIYLPYLIISLVSLFVMIFI
jgi:hypothetical protein